MPVVLAAVRTPVGRYGGGLAGERPDDLAALVIREAVARAGASPDEVEDVYFGAANQAGEDNRNVARMAALLAGLPQSVAGVTVNNSPHRSRNTVRSWKSPARTSTACNPSRW